MSTTILYPGVETQTIFYSLSRCPLTILYDVENAHLMIYYFHCGSDVSVDESDIYLTFQKKKSVILIKRLIDAK